MGAPSLPPPPAAPPAPADTVDPLFRELARQATDRKLRKSKGRGRAFLTNNQPSALGNADPSRSVGTGTVLGG